MILGVIPARFGSSRLLGKPLANIGGKPMIRHTYESTLKSKLLDKVIIAVDDEKVFQVVSLFTKDVIMTPQDIQTGSDRIAFVVRNVPDADIVVNIQGDEPFIKGAMIDEAIEPLLFDKDVDVATLAKKITSVDELKAASIPKVVFDYNNFALYFSRSPIPYVRDAKNFQERLILGNVFKHIGLYVYKRDALLRFTELPQTDLERTEKLEQLRMLENGMRIKIVETNYESISVDTPADLERVRRYYEAFLNNNIEAKATDD